MKSLVRPISCLAIGCLVFFWCVRQLMAAPPAPYARVQTIIGYIANKTTGDDVNRPTAAITDKWIEFVYETHGPIFDANGTPLTFASLTRPQKARFYLNTLRDWHHEMRVRKIRRDASTEAAEATAKTDTDADLGVREE